MRLDEFRLTAWELAIDAHLALGRNDLASGRLEELIAEEPTRERFREQLMLALYRSGRQTDALATYQDARTLLVDRMGIEPGRALRELERAVLRQDEALSLHDADVGERAKAPVATDLALLPDRAIVAAGDSIESIDRLVSVAEPLARQPGRELIVPCLTRDGAGLAETMSGLEERRTHLEQRGVPTRVTTFTFAAAGSDVVRLTTLPDLDEGDLDPDLLEILTDAPCDVGVVWPRSDPVPVGPAAGVFVPFGGDEHEFTAAEVGSWIARANGAEVWLLGRRPMPVTAAGMRAACWATSRSRFSGSPRSCRSRC